MAQHPPLKLRKKEHHRIARGHDWVFSNEVDTRQTPISELEVGALVEVQDNGGRPLGTAFVNPRSLVVARLFSRRPDAALDRDLLARRFGAALALRDSLFRRPYYRLLYGEADGVPGLVVDRYGEVLAVQVLAAAMEARLELLLDLLQETTAASCVVLRNDSRVRKLEGLELYTRTARGRVDGPAAVPEGNGSFLADLEGGQKTGWFYDQRANRLAVRRLARGRTVLDLYCYLGAWSVGAAQGGAKEVLAVDSSSPALALAEENGLRNGVAEVCTFQQDDAIEALSSLSRSGRKFGLVVADPPAFAKSRKHVPEASRAYRKLNRQALTLLEPGGLLITSSCSHQIRPDRFLDTLRRAAVEARREIAILGTGIQAPDHPIHPAMPETEYLKCVTLVAR